MKAEIDKFIRECRKSMEITDTTEEFCDTTTHKYGTRCEPNIIAIDVALIQACNYLEKGMAE